MESILALLMGIFLHAPLQFDVVSIKPNTGGPGPTMVQMPPTGRVNIVNATLRTLLRSAYRLLALPTPPPGLMMNFGVGFAAAAVPFAVLTSTLTQILGRPVIDKTGIKGYYDFKLVFRPEGVAKHS